MPNIEKVLKRQRLLADFGEFALRSQDLDKVLIEACRLVADALETARAKILEIQHGGSSLLVRAGVGWESGIVGHARIAMEENTSESFSIKAREPVVSQDINKEDRFDVPPFMRAAGVIALVNTPIFLPGGRLYGLLEVDDTKARDFGENEIQFLRTYATVLGPVIDRLLMAQTLRSTEERFRLTVEAALDYAIFLSDPQDRITDWLPGAQAVFGWTAEEAVGQPGALTFTPEDRERGQDRWEFEIASKEGVAPDVRWHLCKNGKRVFIEGSTRALCASDGTLQGFLKIGQDVTERREAEERLRGSEERFRQFAEASSDLIWIRNADTMQCEYLSPAFEAIYGESREAFFSGDTFQRWADIVHPDDREQALAGVYRIRTGERLFNAFRIVRPSDGEVRWIENTDFPLFDEHGAVKRVAGLAKDVTETRRYAARLEVLVAELQHRSRNLLSVIASVASKTLGEGELGSDFQARLRALSRAHGLLSEFGSDTAEIGALVRAELEAHTEVTPPKVVLSGPKVHITAAQVQNFSLALHELVTNAVKYGALRNGQGALAVAWTVILNEKGGRELVLDWIESGVDVQPEAVTRRGYGRQLIEKALSYALHAKTEFILGEDGARCHIQLPLD